MNLGIDGPENEVGIPQPQPPDPAGPYVLTTGRLGARKGLEDLIACAALVAAGEQDFGETQGTELL